MAAVSSLVYCFVLCALAAETKAVPTEGPSSANSEDPPAHLVGDGFDTGGIVGIAVAGGVVVIGLILLAIYCCIRNRDETLKDHNYVSRDGNGEPSVYTSGTSQALFNTGSNRYQPPKYGSTEDIRSTTSSQDKANGAYANPAYTREPGERKSDRHASFGKARVKAGSANDAFDSGDKGYAEHGETSWEEADAPGSKRMSRRDDTSMKPAKSAMKKSANIEMGQMGDKPANGILKTRTHSPNRSQTSSTDASLDANAMIYGYGQVGKNQPNIKQKPVIERKRSRSGPRSHRSGSSGGHSRRSKSPDKKDVKNSRMYSDVFIEDRRSRSRSSGRRARSDSSGRRTRSERTSDSVDSGSSTASQSRKVNMNPSGKRVHIKGEETDI